MFSKTELKSHLPIILIILLGAALRLYHITYNPLRFDELGEFYAASQSFSGMLAIVSLHLSPPLDYIIMHYVLMVMPDTDFVIRLPSLVWGILAIPALYLFARKITTKCISLVSAFLLAVFPIAIWYSQTARMYSLFLLLSVISCYFLICVRKGTKYYILWILSGIALIYTHYYAAILIMAQYLYLVSISQLKSDYGLLTKASGGLLMIVASFIPWLPTLIFQLNSGAQNGLLESSIYNDRNFIFIVPFLCIIIAIFIVKVSEKGNSRWFVLFAGGVILIALLPSYYEYYNMQNGEDWRGAGQYLNTHASNGDTIVVIGGLPEFVQHYTDANLVYSGNWNDSNATWYLVSAWSGQFGLNQTVNRSELDLSSRSVAEFHELTLYRKG